MGAWLDLWGKLWWQWTMPFLDFPLSRKALCSSRSASSSLLKSQTRLYPLIPLAKQVTPARARRGKEANSVCFYLCLPFISLNSRIPSSCHWKCYLLSLLTAAVNRAQAVLHRWWEGRLHNSSSPIWFHISPLPFFLFPISLQKQELIHMDRREMSSAALRASVGRQAPSWLLKKN